MSHVDRIPHLPAREQKPLFLLRPLTKFFLGSAAVVIGYRYYRLKTNQVWHLSKMDYHLGTRMMAHMVVVVGLMFSFVFYLHFDNLDDEGLSSKPLPIEKQVEFICDELEYEHLQRTQRLPKWPMDFQKSHDYKAIFASIQERIEKEKIMNEPSASPE